eukprot:5559671-Pyramimonas_sp.AAC.1
MVQVLVRAKERACTRGRTVELGPLAAIRELDALRTRLRLQHSNRAIGLLAEVEADAVLHRAADTHQAPHVALHVVHPSHTHRSLAGAHDGAPSLGVVGILKVSLAPHF